jgi:hypothetical protein
MVYSPAHGEMAFTVPLFDKFLRRAIPEFDPAQAEDRKPIGYALNPTADEARAPAARHLWGAATILINRAAGQ